MSSSVLVTGGAGYIGSVTVERLLAAGRRVVVLDNLSKGHRSAVPPDVPLVTGDIGDTELVARVLREHEVDSVVHFAAMSLVGESMDRPAEYYDNNVVRGSRLLSSMAGAGVSKIVFSSSAGVYGEPESVPILETAPTEPVNVYGDTKRVFERVLAWQSHTVGLKYISLRYFNSPLWRPFRASVVKARTPFSKRPWPSVALSWRRTSLGTARSSGTTEFSCRWGKLPLWVRRCSLSFNRP